MLDEPTGSGIELRSANEADADLIWRILCLASSWRDDDTPIDMPEANPAYYEGWGRSDDVGVLLFRGIEFVGGAYARRVSPADGTYGYHDPQFWELTMGVENAQRRKGLGRLAVEVLKAKVMERGIRGLSLSTELDNVAARVLYESARFETIEERETDVLMAWKSSIPAVQ